MDQIVLDSAFSLIDDFLLRLSAYDELKPYGEAASKGGSMTFDGFDAEMLNDVQQVAPLLLPTESGDGPSLQDALAERRAATAPHLGLSDGPGEAQSEPGSNGSMSLRPLSTDELLLIAGSDATVTGPSPWDWDWWNPYPDGNGGSGGGGSELRAVGARARIRAAHLTTG